MAGGNAYLTLKDQQHMNGLLKNHGETSLSGFQRENLGLGPEVNDQTEKEFSPHVETYSAIEPEDSESEDINPYRMLHAMSKAIDSGVLSQDDEAAYKQYMSRFED